MVFKKSLFVVSVVSATALLGGCSKSLKSVTPQEQSDNLLAELKKTKYTITATDIDPSTVKMTDFPLLTDVCKASYKSPKYSYNGQLLRFKRHRFSYKAPMDTEIINDSYAVCLNFYPPVNQVTGTVAVPTESQPISQEAIFVRYLGTTKSDLAQVLQGVSKVEGSGKGLLVNAGFHTGDVVDPNGWGAIERVDYKKNADNPLYIKMEKLNMKVLHSYGAGKYKSLLAYEVIHIVYTMVNGELKIESFKLKTMSDILREMKVKV